MHFLIRSAGRFLLAAALATVVAVPVRAQTFVNFDDLAPSVGGGAALPSPYQGYTWSFGGTPMGWISPGSPYTDDVCRSGTNCAYNGFGLISGVTSATPFTFSGWLRRWNWSNDAGGATSVLIEALNGASVVGSVTVQTSASYQFFQLLAPMTTLRFTPQGGSGLGCAQGSANCGYFLLDDVTFNPSTAPTPSVVPEPSAYLLMLTGLLAMVVVRQRRRRA